ncbi:hypothetical protein GDO86_013221 [Hymenochirus boettgeri]|uniref:Beta-microseminoprotein n=1 Tax=Hymenochirus boettgeri TaxID=247094 RepID=A0A8T2IUF6_9PIPI|nr:hypothetical protein GDO86_013221 [Hymenochirus boettgeri]
MRYLLAALCLIAVLACSCDAQCFVNPPNVFPRNQIRGCLYEGKVHPLDSEWKTKDCKKCNCNPDGYLGCCNTAAQPVDFDKEHCKSVFYEKECLYKVVRKDDPSKECEVYSMVS